MKISLKDIKNWFKKINLKKKEFANLSSKAAYDWKIMLILFFLMVVLIAGLNIFLFLKINSGDIFISNGTREASEASINKEDLNRVITLFADKTINLEILRKEKRASFDPSL